MQFKAPSIILIAGSLLTIFIVLLTSSNMVMTARGQNSDPILSDAGAYTNYVEDGKEFVFTVIYTDLDSDDGDVFLHIDSNDPIKMGTIEQNPKEGQYFEIIITTIKITDDSEFRFSANDTNGSLIYFPPQNQDALKFGDFDGWGEPPILSSPDVFFDGDDWVFNVTYNDPDGDKARVVDLILNDETYIHMATSDTDPLTGQNYTTKVLETQVNNDTGFYFSADDVEGSFTDLYDSDYRRKGNDIPEPPHQNMRATPGIHYGEGGDYQEQQTSGQSPSPWYRAGIRIKHR